MLFKRIFRGIKQMGIRNYDRAITYFLDAKVYNLKNGGRGLNWQNFTFIDKQFEVHKNIALEAVKVNQKIYTMVRRNHLI